ncbi:APH(3')-II family aminoglycoside O-phosphotransferase [Pseudomonas fluorescens]|uniref:Aminoglycoside 3'-phosphotransferase n=1 Tax=Pseudomonas fluorescens TaxID=294 RepID=A0A5E6ZHL9_PSEFL|nr:APH(3') family aminoglycoside O-phosphotransferase [Pseudomonas fluorescens]VVN65335.1 Aminoglycoside 3'-phosphotransferase [Pseudomonas fluorescens]VVP73131.1 Aminoglycoside 3'-phosphotransferase [Pseudomonas fluorescens]
MDFPTQWGNQLSGAQIERQAIGESRADVFRIRSSNGQDLFLKSEVVGLLNELPDEIERLRWLGQLELPGPSVLDATTENNHHWLLMSAVPGQDLASASNLSASQIISIVAMALRTLHQVPIAKCPFESLLEQRIATARDRVSAGLVDETDFDEQRLGRTAEDVFAELLSTLPRTHDLVVTHGDACLPNLMADADQFTGFIDCGRLGVSDRFQDLALAARSIERNLGGQWVAPFFQRYGVEPDDQRMVFYCLLDEFF